MTFAPLLTASTAIQVHVAAITAAVVLTVFQLAGLKGSVPHRVLGYAWVAAMVIAAASSFWISTIKVWGPFSPIHLLSIFTLVTVPLGVIRARQHAIRAHKIMMLNIAFWALGGAGLFALALPGRIMHQVLFGG